MVFCYGSLSRLTHKPSIKVAIGKQGPNIRLELTAEKAGVKTESKELCLGRRRKGSGCQVKARDIRNTHLDSQATKGRHGYFLPDEGPTKCNVKEYQLHL